MTSNISLRKLTRISAGARGWLFIVMSAACALLLPVALLMRLQTIGSWFGPASPAISGAQAAAEQLALKQSAILFICGPENILVWAGVIIAAMLAAFSGYAFLQSRSKVDFYHSLAIRREKLFFAPYIGGALLTVLPYVVCALIALFAVGGTSGALDAGITRTCLLAMGIFVLSFFAVYSVLILGMILAGRMVTGILFGVLLILYGPLCYKLIQGLFSMSFSTYVDTGGRWGGFALSPATMLPRMAQAAQGGAVPVWMFLQQLVFAAAGIVLSIVLYRLRPSEAAENALIHPRMHGFVKVILVIPGAILTGILFYGFTNVSGWLFAGALIGALLLGWLVDAVFDRDIRGFLAHKPSGILTLAVTAAILLIFRADIFGYDRYLPAKERVEAMAILPGRGTSALGDYYLTSEQATRDYLHAGMTTDCDALYELAREGVGNARRNSGFFQVMESVPYEEGAEQETILIAYRLSGGGVRYRQYQVDARRAAAAEQALAEDAGYREKVYPVFYLTPDDLRDCSLFIDSSPYVSKGVDLPLAEAERTHLLDCLREDAVRCSIAELAESRMCGELLLGMFYGEDRALICNSLYIYPQYTRTLAFLEEKGFSLL